MITQFEQDYFQWKIPKNIDGVIMYDTFINFDNNYLKIHIKKYD